MRKTIAIDLFIFIALAACGPTDLGLTMQAHKTPNALTIAYGEEVRSAIEFYVLTRGSLEVQLNPDMLQNIMTGPALQQRISAGGLDRIYVTRSLSLQEVRVLEYDSAHFKAVACGSIEQEEVTTDGEFVRALMGLDFFQTIYVFLREDNTWKYATGYNFAFTERSPLLRDWASAQEWQRELIGDLPNYALEHALCGR